MASKPLKPLLYPKTKNNNSCAKELNLRVESGAPMVIYTKRRLSKVETTLKKVDKSVSLCLSITKKLKIPRCTPS